MEIIRHGDVLLKPIESLPKEAKKIYSGKSYVVALGEFTGHSHILTAERENLIDIFEDEQGRKYIVPHFMSTLTHQEHKTLTVQPGVYRLDKEREFDYFSKKINQVRD